MNKIAFICSGLLIAYYIAKRRSKAQDGDVELLSIAEVNSYIQETVRSEGDVIWKNSPINVLYSAIMIGNGVLTVGYGKEGEFFSESKSESLINDKERIIEIGLTHSSAVENLIVHDYGVLNSVDLRLKNVQMLEELVSSDSVRYLDPVEYKSFKSSASDEVAIQQDFGCDKGEKNVNEEDYRVESPNSWVPWNLDYHNVSDAWDYSTGKGITIGLIDTGISSKQELLGDKFNNGLSAERTVEKYGTFDEFDDDQCGHGTSMASVMVSPRNDKGMPLGAAYNANLVAYRATRDVLLDGSVERRGVSEALKQLGERDDVQIISMSLGYMWSIGSVKDAVIYAESKGKLIFAAGGTSSFNWYGVTFPGSMKETVAVTGINDAGKKCSNCHSGREIDFTIQMQRAEDSSRVMPCIGYYSGERSVNGGSSIATATTAGIAALVWARDPSMTKDQVLEKLKESSQYYPEKHGSFGYGTIDALKAVNI